MAMQTSVNILFFVETLLQMLLDLIYSIQRHVQLINNLHCLPIIGYIFVMVDSRSNPFGKSFFE